MSCRDREVERVKKEAGPPPFGVSQGFLCSSIIECLVFIIIQNSMNVKKAEADKIRRTVGKEKHVFQVQDHSFATVFQAEAKAHLSTAW